MDGADAGFSNNIGIGIDETKAATLLWALPRKTIRRIDSAGRKGNYPT